MGILNQRIRGHDCIYVCIIVCYIFQLQKPGICWRLFRRSMDKDSHLYSDQDEVLGIRDSCLTNTNCVLLQLRYTTHDRHSDSRNKDIANDRTDITARKEILQNIAGQITAKHHEDEKNELSSGSTSESRKRASPTGSVLSCENASSPPKGSCCSADPDMPSLSNTLTTPCHSVSSTESAKTQSVSKPASSANLPALCCDRFIYIYI
jgi:hypothetical protein